MKRRSFKRFLALTLAGTLALSTVAFATTQDVTSGPSTGTMTGEGEVEDIIDMEAFHVVLPTQTVADATFDFTMDPQKLLKATGASGYADASLFFENTSGNYSATSNPLSVVNKSSYEVDVALKATVEGLTDGTESANPTYTINLVDSSALTSDTTTSMYLGLSLYEYASGTKGSAETTALNTNGVQVTKKLDAAPSGAYEVTSSSGSYSYALKADTSGITFDQLDFELTGACNTNTDVDWTAAETATPKVKIAWDIKKHVDGPQVSVTSAGLITVSNLTSEKAYSSMTTTGSTDTKAYPVSSTKGTFDKSQEASGIIKCQLNSGTVAYYAGQTLTITVTLSDGSTITGSVEIPAA